MRGVNYGEKREKSNDQAKKKGTFSKAATKRAKNKYSYISWTKLQLPNEIGRAILFLAMIGEAQTEGI
jgi:hypothetical protein